MNAQTENKIRTETAEYHMRIVREDKNNEMMICQTLVGNVTLQYSDRIYTLLGELSWEEIMKDENAQRPIIAHGKKSAVIEELKKVYEIIQ